MKKLSLLGAMCTCLAAVSFNANAALIEVDWLSTGDKKITRDVTNGLDWLDLDLSINLDVSEVTGMLGSGGAFEGFRYATVDEVANLYTSAGLFEHLSGDVGDRALVVAFQDMRGRTPSSATDYGITGTHGATSNGQRIYSEIHSSVFNNITTVLSNAGEIETNQRDDRWGHMLVKTSPVPIPSAAWLFGSGLIGIIGVARRKVRG